MYSDRFDDSEFDMDQILLDLEESVNLYEESLKDDLIAKGKESYNKAIRKIGAENDKIVGRKFNEYEKKDAQYQKKSRDPFVFDKLKAASRRDEYNKLDRRFKSDIQKRNMQNEKEYNSRVRQASNQAEKDRALADYQEIQNGIRGQQQNYQHQLNEMNKKLPKNKREEEQMQKDEHYQNIRNLRADADKARDAYRKEADKYVKKNSLYSAKNTATPIQNGKPTMSKLDRKALRRAYKEMDAERDRQRMNAMTKDARRNGYFADPTDHKRELKNHLAAQNKLPDYMKGFED